MARPQIVSTILPVTGVVTNDDVTNCLQALYDIFTEIGVGQATFEVTEHGTELFIKHQDAIVPNLPMIDAALRRAGNYAIQMPSEGD